MATPSAYLDATYKTTQYSLPLFFVCVRTNVGYIIVPEFIVETEDSEIIAEALKVIKIVECQCGRKIATIKGDGSCLFRSFACSSYWETKKSISMFEV